MAYYTVDEAVNIFIERYKDLTKAIIKAQTMKNKASSNNRYNFWLDVENKLKETRLNNKRLSE
jgi:hypothetical protein